MSIVYNYTVVKIINSVFNAAAELCFVVREYKCKPFMN